MRTKVLAVDPGLTTGWVVFYPIARYAEEFNGPQIVVINWGETRGDFAFLNGIAWPYKHREGCTHAVVENFIPWQDRTRTWEPEALWITGALRWMFTPEACFSDQRPGDAHRFGTDTKLFRYRNGSNPVGKGGEGHALMALRHALLWTGTKWDGK